MKSKPETYGHRDNSTSESVPRLDTSTDCAGESVVDFWQWAFSDILTNINRAVFGECLVGRALGLTHGKTRRTWDYVDFEYEGHAIEVKSTGFSQRWEAGKTHTNSFDIEAKIPTRFRRPSPDKDAVPERSGEVYVFAVFNSGAADIDSEAVEDVDSEAVTDISKWGFYVFPRSELDERWPNQKKVSFNVVKKTGKKLYKYSELKDEIVEAVKLNV
jgi:hypothetical protein